MKTANDSHKKQREHPRYGPDSQALKGTFRKAHSGFATHSAKTLKVPIVSRIPTAYTQL